MTQRQTTTTNLPKSDLGELRPILQDRWIWVLLLLLLLFRVGLVVRDMTSRPKPRMHPSSMRLNSLHSVHDVAGGSSLSPRRIPDELR